MGTIDIATRKKSLKSLKMILEHIIELYGTVKYRDLFMHDISKIIEEKNLKVFDFFGRSFTEKKSAVDMSLCKMEQQLKSVEVPSFSSERNQEIKIDVGQIVDIDIEKAVIKRIKHEYEEDEKQIKNQKRYEIEHMYIDLRTWTLSEKL